MEWRTRITDLLGCKYPILQGALTKIGDWKFAAAVSRAGAEGCLTAAVSLTPEKLREDIRRCRDAAEGNTFSVNLSVGYCPHIDEMLEVSLEEGIHTIETAAFNGDKYGKRAKEAGAKWIHKTATVKHALHAEAQGADAVIIVGLEGIGFKNLSQLPTMTTTTWATRQMRVPVVAAGGIGDGRGFLGALGMGAEGIMMGTAFMATKECPIKESYKQAMVKARPDDPPLRKVVLADPDPKAYEEVMKKRGEMPLEKWLVALERVMLKHPEYRDVPYMWEYPLEELSGLMSMAVSGIERIPTLKEFIDGILQEAEEILKSWQFLKTG